MQNVLVCILLSSGVAWATDNLCSVIGSSDGTVSDGATPYNGKIVKVTSGPRGPVSIPPDDWRYLVTLASRVTKPAQLNIFALAADPHVPTIISRMDVTACSAEGTVFSQRVKSRYLGTPLPASGQTLRLDSGTERLVKRSQGKCDRYIVTIHVALDSGAATVRFASQKTPPGTHGAR